VKVRSPDGQTWRVSRRWVPWRRRLRGAIRNAHDLPLSSLGDDLISLVIGIVLVPFIIVAVVAGLELLLLLPVLPFALLGRVLFGRHWTVEVRRGWKPVAEERSGDWQESGLLIHALADRVRRGEYP
jgi:hypothetical protein